MLHVVSTPSRDNSIAEAEWGTRVDLAAAHRLAEQFGWTQLIYNHFTCRVPGEPDHFLVKPHQWMFREVTASSLVKVDLDGRAVEPNITVNAAGFAIHTAVLKARADVNAVVHIHTDAGIAISAHKEGLRFMSQASMRFYGSLAYHDYQGVAEIEEGESLARDLGAAKAMILRNHGLLVVGRSIAEAMSRLNYLMSAIESQLKLEAAGAHNILIPPPEVCAHAAAQWNALEEGGKLTEWPAMLRWMDQIDAGYRA
jgi:ribulose-5-phosphate 4-epimerase/fuculose-1-phosphate aldolase